MSLQIAGMARRTTLERLDQTSRDRAGLQTATGSPVTNARDPAEHVSDLVWAGGKRRIRQAFEIDQPPRARQIVRAHVTGVRSRVVGRQIRPNLAPSDVQLVAGAATLGVQKLCGARTASHIRARPVSRPQRAVRSLAHDPQRTWIPARQHAIVIACPRQLDRTVEIIVWGETIELEPAARHVPQHVEPGDCVRHH